MKKPAEPDVDVPVPRPFPACEVLLVGGPADGRVIQATDKPVIRLHQRHGVLEYERDPKVPTTAVFKGEANGGSAT